MTIQELETYFNAIDLPQEIQIDRAHRITNVRLYIDTNLTRAKINGMKPLFGNGYAKLMHLKEILDITALS
jgi:hypothetical protein